MLQAGFLQAAYSWVLLFSFPIWQSLPLVGEVRSLTFQVIINMAGLKSIIFQFVFSLFHLFFGSFCFFFCFLLDKWRISLWSHLIFCCCCCCLISHDSLVCCFSGCFKVYSSHLSLTTSASKRIHPTPRMLQYLIIIHFLSLFLGFWFVTCLPFTYVTNLICCITFVINSQLSFK